MPNHCLQIISISAIHIFSFSVSFLSRVKTSSINWPAPNVWVFIVQVVEQCSANAEATSTNPLEASKILFLGLIRNCFNCDYNFDGLIFIS